jgi:cellulose synthase/poly-beta-1,6-N-acetylglucosamine synthase-like glycosyltransferase
MNLILLSEILFWLSVILVAHTYLIYPVFIRLLSSYKNSNNILFSFEEMPKISIIMAAHNEEKVIEQKVKSVFQGNYPIHRIEFLIGTDNCSDSTAQIIRDLKLSYPQIKLYEFKERQGKIRIVNQLVEKTTSNFLLLTDANVIFSLDTIEQLIKHFKNDKIGLVDSLMVNTGLKNDGISYQEKSYISMEVWTKNAEGIVWGSMMGPFGGCFAIRKEVFSSIPLNFLVDDFYLNMRTLQKGFHCINEANAMVYEDVSNNLKEEFRRKARISAGNYQNLAHFFSMLFRFDGISFAFFSHKVLRWFTPFLLIGFAFFSIFLLEHRTIYLYSSILLLFIILLIGFDLILTKFRINVSIFRFLTHFSAMNLALFIGFFKFIRGIKSSVWEPTKRLQ